MATTYEIVLTAAARRNLKSLPRTILKRVDAKLLGLGLNPRPPDAKKLRDRDGLMRVRVGDYRILYRVEDERLVVLVVRIGHRREVYR
ncbi:MAG: type II toxin-antitoxin system RelE/ParE family toxin [Planctomycetes bacterium]|nr:type II toxin-antitoxin system RelE/ParE family toxin [Planctomycetota bacterium]MBU4397750.1 type II toxin-antitoxin system RelE/ParE family toxin [Planctomycetota bacterium]MCG2684231.1 type II toxin-antitoxin system RelE/ParE family toxin [Planctomycetales bacterium]